MQRFKYSLTAAAGILILAFVLNLIGPRRVMAALGYTPVRDVDNPLRNPYQVTISLTGNNTQSVRTSLVVPQGYRLRIEYVSATFRNNGPGIVSIGPMLGSPLPSVHVPFREPIGVPIRDLVGEISEYTGGKQLDFYGEPGQEVQVRAFFERVGPVIGEVTIVGHLLSLP